MFGFRNFGSEGSVVSEGSAVSQASVAFEGSVVSKGYVASLCTTEDQFLLRSTIFVLRRTSLYYRETFCPAEYQFVLRSFSLYY